mmetsp:Transcript_69009/g.191033  ORF Transcript_69009/g.191033 Transcript_69009/m.191033 type:complete len:148 (+) Transcript_69009:122-565(+)|eukprot:CAMPEP_0179026396 /NCGR_PEP_ID=MMETSP0796-20121207/8492_1 /TAXON_ID=73915 /ORGANISM="Pyrodinium bahamense, Strain pbaha01" /LENGTH=147 /DNA_ID=CAMNT_0020722473 /DNA_START=88 /DNA_END=531 /DNA_ORIENTATION=+
MAPDAACLVTQQRSATHFRNGLQQPGQDVPELDSLIRKAQLEAGLKRMEVQAAEKPVLVTPDAVFGNWTDSYGNTVCVYSADAFNAQLIATLSKPPRHDINLKLQPVEIGCGWHCGGAALVGSTTTQLWWLFPDGNVSIWTRKPGGQ